VTPILSLTGVVYAWPGAPPALNGADLTLAPGERVAIVGPNGAGKSTLLRLIVGLSRPQAGEIAAFGRPRRAEADFHEVRRRIGLVFQDPDDQLFCPTVIDDVAFGPENLGLGRAGALAAADAALDRLGLRSLRDRVTHRLSGGEKRLVTLAAVLAMGPEALLLDEPTNGLDAEAEARVTGILSDLPLAMVVVSHDAAFRARLAQRSLRLSDGRLSPA
jgi:cobalt/nickel transport system ATP-binding protein